jgi:hypothetical protein
MKNILTFLLFSFCSALSAQDIYRSEYPDGLYATKEDFINKTPSSTVEIFPQRNASSDWDWEENVPDEVFFRYESSRSKVKHTFAISYKGFLYFQNGQIIKKRNRSKKDKDQTTHDTNAFVRVRHGGDRFLYTETELHSAWEAGVAYNFGAAGAAIAGDLARFKGIVWDLQKQEFNIFRNCKDLNDFLAEHSPEDQQACSSKKYDILAVREVILKIK